MMRYQSYPGAVGTALWAILPWSPAWLIGCPFGIWALVTLRRAEIQEAFGVSPRPRDLLAAPARALFLTGVLAWLFWAILGVSLFAASRPYTTDLRYVSVPGKNQLPRWETVIRPFHERWLFLLMPLFAAPAAGILIIGANKMAKTRSYQFAVVTAMWAMLPWSPLVVVGIPFGIWALRILRRREVQALFGLPYSPAGSPFERPLVLAPVPEPPRPTGPVRRRVRGFLGSMYSLLVKSRPPQESELPLNPEHANIPAAEGDEDSPR
jgi:hypothetical protein